MGGFLAAASTSHSAGLVTSGLLAYIDAGNPQSYPGTGTTITDLSGQAATGTINGAVTWINRGDRSYWWWPAAAAGNYISSTKSQVYLDVTIVFQPDFTLTSDAGLVGVIATSAAATNGDTSLRLLGANGTGPWTTRNPDNTDGWASTATNYYINGVSSTTDATSIRPGWNVLGGARTNTTKAAWSAGFAYFLGTEGYSVAVRDFRGNIAAVALYSRTLTAQEQQQNYFYFGKRYGV